MLTVLVLGSEGMLGHVLYKKLKEQKHITVKGLSRRDGEFTDIKMDASDFHSLEQHLHDNNYDVVINCIGVLISASENCMSNAVLMNSYLPHFFNEQSLKHQFKFIHISTDCVFSGIDGSYTVNSKVDGEGMYAKSKALGELISETSLVIRTSIIGPELKLGTGLYNWCIQQRGELTGYSKAYWTGLTTMELSKMIIHILDGALSHGLYQLVPARKISKYELLSIINNEFNLDLTIHPCDQYKVDKSLVCNYPDLGVINDYKTMIKEMKHWVTINRELYSHSV
ncbi:putative reductase [Lentisphaera araneosa HTCC2155]|uniref:dTDP-4-dehydrorhamnose reductase n=1 Tax=Lentisphaera araneosa HTCC2155 TaxID=313628 RepID=A6DT10_9BACT|nr:sugar nucleotide-binding protein [Lentisphaera araneosa]EDM25185.1 putative reductase [Lentisphaera araneosa HTCC2155]